MIILSDLLDCLPHPTPVILSSLLFEAVQDLAPLHLIESIHFDEDRIEVLLLDLAINEEWIL